MNKDDHSIPEFFLPDLCNARALFFLVLVAELLAVVLALAANDLSRFDWSAFSLTSLYLQWNVLLSAAVLCRLRNRLSGLPVKRAAAASYLLIIAVVVLTSIAGQWLLSRAVDGWQLLTHILIAAVLAGIALRYFYLTQQLRLQQQTELQARIQALQSRIRPHFLFNSMNIIASLIAEDQQAAETAVEDLAALFRASLAEAATEVTLAEELDVCRRYARIEQLRLGQRLQLDWQLQQGLEQLPIPSLTLQPLLENAIYHGIQQLPQGGTVTVSGGLQNGVLTLSVENPLPQSTITAATVTKDKGNRMAIANIHNRLQALYGASAGLRTEVSATHHTAILQYPVQ